MILRASRALVIGDVMTDVIVRPEGPIARGSDRRASTTFRPDGSAGQSGRVARGLRRSPRRYPVLTSRIANHAARLRYPTLGESRTREADTGRRAAA